MIVFVSLVHETWAVTHSMTFISSHVCRNKQSLSKNQKEWTLLRPTEFKDDECDRGAESPLPHSSVTSSVHTTQSSTSNENVWSHPQASPAHMNIRRILGVKAFSVLPSMTFTLSWDSMMVLWASSNSSFPTAAWTRSRHALSWGLPSNMSRPAPTGWWRGRGGLMCLNQKLIQTLHIYDTVSL